MTRTFIISELARNNCITLLKVSSVFRMNTDFQKADFFYRNVGIPESVATMTDPEKHWKFRKHCRPFFTIRSVDEMYPLVNSQIERAQNKLYRSVGQELDFHQHIRCTIVRIQPREESPKLASAHINPGRYHLRATFRSIIEFN
jgi:hypothetical protein